MAVPFVSKYVVQPNTTVWVNNRDSERETVGVGQMVRQALPVDYFAPATGNTVAASDLSTGMNLEPAGTIAALTVTMPANPIDGQTFFLTSTATVTTLTQNAAAGQTLNGALTTITATRTTHASWVYRAANKTWYVLA